MSRASLVACLLAAALVAGCGGDDGSGDGGARAREGPTAAKLRQDLREATQSTPADFPPTRGRTLQQVADEIGATGPELAPATSVFTPGRNRFAFGLVDPESGFVYGKTAVYVARTPKAQAKGPFPAPADLLVTEAPYRSRTAASEKDPFAAIYQATVPLERPGRAYVLAVTIIRGRAVAATGTVKVVPKEREPVPAVGDRAPVVETDTVESAGGDIEAIDTRVPPDDMHGTSFADVVGKKPVALLFATPQLCQSRVCGPVVDIAAQLKATYGDRVEFIHQEVYVDNEVEKGLRPPLRRFGLPSEPWLFTVDREGRIAARLEGSFGLDGFERAVRAALRLP